jgi:hypothetical protein
VTLTAVVGDIDMAVGRRLSTRGDAFAMTVDGVRFGKRPEAGERLVRLLAREADGLDTAQRHTRAQVGHLGGFNVTAAIDRVLSTTQFVMALDGVPGSEIRLTAEDLASTDPAGLVTRLENRLSGLAALRTKTLEEIGRLRTEAVHASDDLGKSFPKADQLTVARERVQEIGEKLRKAAEPAQQSENRVTGADGLDPATAGTAANLADDATFAGHQRREPARVAHHSFPGHDPAVQPAGPTAVAVGVVAVQASRNARPAR